MTRPLATSRDAVVVPLPRVAPSLSDNRRSVNLPEQAPLPEQRTDAELAGERKMREAATRHSLNLLAATSDAGTRPWQADALCAETDPEEFFPEKGGSTRAAKRICTGCEVRLQCLEYALANDERFGIWGGLSERERRRLRRQP